MDTLPPWIDYPSLTAKRLGIIGRIIADVRHDAVVLHQSLLGDNNWSLGCRVYARTCHALLKAVDLYPDWLSVIEQVGLHFVFAVGGTPLRFYKGEPDNTPSRSLHRNFPEIHAHQFSLFSDMNPLADNILRIAIETDEMGEAFAITLVELDQEGSLLRSWPIAYDEVASITTFAAQKDGVELAPVKVLPFKGQKKADDEIN